MKIAYFGFDLFYSCLELIAAENEIIKIFTCKVDEDFETTHKTRRLANKYSIPVTDKKITPDDILQLEKSGCDLIISAGYYHKIPCSKTVRSVNIHPAMLPIGRGPWPMPVSILRGDTQTGVTLHELADSFDEGDIILQKTVDISQSDNLSTLTDKLVKTSRVLLSELLLDFDNYWMKKAPQNVGEYWKEPGVNEMTFTLNDPFELIDRITRAFFGYKCFLKKDSKIIEIKKAICYKSKAKVPNNVQVVDIDNGYLCILQLS